jgi:hypothetical protein
MKMETDSWFFAEWCGKWESGFFSMRSDSLVHEMRMPLFSPFLGANLGFGGRRIKQEWC